MVNRSLSWIGYLRQLSAKELNTYRIIDAVIEVLANMGEVIAEPLTL